MNKIMHNRKIILSFTIVFISGIVIGFLSASLMDRQIGSRPTDMPHFRDRLTNRMAHRLKLDKSQTAATAVIINKMWDRIQEVRRNSYSEIEKIIDNSFADIAPLLRPEQQTELLKLKSELAQRRRYRQRCRGRGGYGRQGGGWHKNRQNIHPDQSSYLPLNSTSNTTEQSR